MKKSRRGFASMDREVNRAIAQKGGRMAHKLGVAHEWTPDEAKLAGRKGGQMRHPRLLGNVPLEEARKLFLEHLEAQE